MSTGALALLSLGAGAGIWWLFVRWGAALYLGLHASIGLGAERAPLVHALLVRLTEARGIPLPILVAGRRSTPVVFVVRRVPRHVVGIAEQALERFDASQLRGTIALLVAALRKDEAKARASEPGRWFRTDRDAVSMVGSADVAAALNALALAEQEPSPTAPPVLARALSSLIEVLDCSIILPLPRQPAPVVRIAHLDDARSISSEPAPRRPSDR